MEVISEIIALALTMGVNVHTVVCGIVNLLVVCREVLLAASSWLTSAIIVRALAMRRMIGYAVNINMTQTMNLKRRCHSVAGKHSYIYSIPTVLNSVPQMVSAPFIEHRGTRESILHFSFLSGFSRTPLDVKNEYLLIVGRKEKLTAKKLSHESEGPKMSC